MGSVRLLTDAAGSATDRYSYDGFGNVVGRTGSTANAYLYRGEQFDAALVLQYLRARWVSDVSGRFLTADTWEGCSCDPLSQNQYLYAHGNPVNLIDPTGHNAGESGSLYASGIRWVRFLKSLDKAAIDRICISVAMLRIAAGDDPGEVWRRYAFCMAWRRAPFN